MSDVIKVTVDFKSAIDEIFKVVDLKATISYHLPDEFGFNKYKNFEVTLIEETDFQNWLKQAMKLRAGDRIKHIAYKEVTTHIMNRLRKDKRNQTDMVYDVLNMFTQMKFDFKFDMEEARKMIEAENECFEKNTVDDDLFN